MVITTKIVWIRFLGAVEIFLGVVLVVDEEISEAG